MTSVQIGDTRYSHEHICATVLVITATDPVFDALGFHHRPDRTDGGFHVVYAATAADIDDAQRALAEVDVKRFYRIGDALYSWGMLRRAEAVEILRDDAPPPGRRPCTEGFPARTLFFVERDAAEAGRQIAAARAHTEWCEIL